MNHLLQQKNAGCAGLIFPLLSGQHQGLGASQVGGYPEMQQHSPWATIAPEALVSLQLKSAPQDSSTLLASDSTWEGGAGLQTTHAEGDPAAGGCGSGAWTASPSLSFPLAGQQ